MTQERILIVGGGVAGLATAWFLVRSGATDVVVLEGEEQLGTHSSALNAGILRTLGRDRRLAELAGRSAAFLREPPEGFSEGPLVEERGLALGLARAARSNWAGSEEGGARWLTPEERARLLPHYRPEDPEEEILFAPRDGTLHIDRLVAGYAAGARAGGAALETGCRVRGLTRSGDRTTGVELADGGRMDGRVVLAAGGWAGRLGEAAGSRVRLRPTRRHLATSGAAPEADPAAPVVWSDAAGFYARPHRGGWMLCVCDEEDADPSHPKEDPEVLKELLGTSRERLTPPPAEPFQAFWCGVRTLTHDGRFAIGPDPDLEGLHWVAGLGGHGMLASPEVGRLAARSIRTGETAPEHDPARLATAPAMG